jgi:hypothetical protein
VLLSGGSTLDYNVFVASPQEMARLVPTTTSQ